LVLTVGLLAVVVYLYTVVAFNFFRKFYNKSEDGELPDMKCDDMLTCYMFHMYVGVRAGGGIGDQIEDPAGDEYEIYRIIFDITFFFFVIVILLAIIQDLSYRSLWSLPNDRFHTPLHFPVEEELHLQPPLQAPPKTFLPAVPHPDSAPTSSTLCLECF
ncbi:ryanodine receptor 2, partial [Lates japonicus]